MSTRDRSKERNGRTTTWRWTGARGEPKAVGPQVPIDPDNPKPPGINPKAQPVSGDKKDG